MAVPSSELVGDLKTLRKGRGLLVTQIDERVGPALRELCGVTDGDGPMEVRRKVAARLQGLARGLPEDLCVAVMAAFAIHPDARQPFYQDRVRWVAEYLRRDERTARRRVDEGTGRLAEIAMASAGNGNVGPKARPAGWHIEALRVSLVLDQASPETFEQRRIVADRDDLDELDLALTLPYDHGLPGVTHDLIVDVFYGGTLIRKAKESTDRFGFALALPKRLLRQETHEFALRFRVPDGQVMRPHHTCVSKHRCDLFDLRVRFGRTTPPQQIWQLTDAFQRDVDDPTPHGELLEVDGAGEIHLQFSHLTPGLAYGARWSYS